MQVFAVLGVVTSLLLGSVVPATAEADGPDAWRVVGVRPDDVLNLHAGASARSRTIAGIPHDAKGIRNLGCRGAPTFQHWQRMTEAERERSTRARWCRVSYNGQSGWVAGRFLAEDSAPPQSGKASSTIGPWTVACAGVDCSIEQTGIAASRRTTLRVEPREGANARIIVERAALPSRGSLSVYMDGEAISAGAIAPIRSKDGRRLVMEPDDVTVGLLRHMERHKNMVVSFPGEERGVEFHLEEFARARSELDRLKGTRP